MDAEFVQHTQGLRNTRRLSDAAPGRFGGSPSNTSVQSHHHVWLGIVRAISLFRPTPRALKRAIFKETSRQ